MLQVNTILLDSSMTYVPSLSETSESLKINKEVLRNLRVGESIRCFPIPLFVLIGLVWGGGGEGGFVCFIFCFSGSNCRHTHTQKKGLHGYCQVSVDCWSQSSYYFGLLIRETTGKANTGNNYRTVIVRQVTEITVNATAGHGNYLLLRTNTCHCFCRKPGDHSKLSCSSSSCVFQAAYQASLLCEPAFATLSNSYSA